MNNLAPGSVVAFYNDGKLCVGVLLSFDQSHAQLLSSSGEIALPLTRILISGPILEPEPSLLEAYQRYLEKIQDSLETFSSQELDRQLDSEPKPWMELVWPDKTTELVAFLFSREHPDIYAWKKSSLRFRSPEEREKLVEERSRKNEYNLWLEDIGPKIKALLDNQTPKLDTESRLRVISEIRDFQLTGKHSSLISYISSLNREDNLEKRLHQVRQALQDLEPGTDPILASSGLPVGFPPDLKIEISEPATNSPIIQAFSIDEEDSSDLDDAISLEELEDGYILGIHISDLASRLDPASELFNIARERVSSLYLAPGVTPLLPLELSQETFSLKEGNIRPCLSLSLHLNRSYDITDWQFHFSQVEIIRNYSYREVDRALDQIPFNTLRKISRAFSDQREKQNPELQEKQIVWYFKLAGDRIVGKRIDFSSPSRQIVEELMVSYNSLFATRARALNLPLLFRNVSTTGITDTRQNSKAFLSTQPDYHPGLGVSAYAHASSPIRRFTDLVNQMQMQAALTGRTPHFSVSALEDLILPLEDRLLALRELAQASERYWFLSFLKQDHLDDPLPAVVVKQVRNTVWLELPDWGKKIQLKTDTQVRIGEELQVVVHEVDPSKGIAEGYLIS